MSDDVRFGSLKALHLTTPARITSSIRKFLAYPGADVSPVYLPFIETSADYVQQHCHSNCEAENRRSGADIIYGWLM